MPLFNDYDKPSYLQAFLLGSANVTAALAAGAVGVLLSIPFGLDGLVITGVCFAAGELLGLLYIPELAGFRHAVDRQYADRLRRMQVDNLLDLLREHAGSEDGTRRMEVYHHIVEHVDTLEGMVRSRTCSLKPADIDRLRDAIRDYLARWLACEAVKDRQRQVRLKDVEHRLEIVEEMLASDRTDIDRRQLHKAQEDYARLIARQKRLGSRMMAIDASLMSIPDAIEEVFQHAVSVPMASDASERLQEAVDRLRIEQELEEDIREELQGLSGNGAHHDSKVVPLTRAAAPAAAVRQASGERQ